MSSTTQFFVTIITLLWGVPEWQGRGIRISCHVQGGVCPRVVIALEGELLPALEEEESCIKEEYRIWNLTKIDSFSFLPLYDLRKIN